MSVKLVPYQPINNVKLAQISNAPINFTQSSESKDEVSFSSNKEHENSDNKKSKHLIKWDGNKFNNEFKNSLILGGIFLAVEVLAYFVLKK